MRKTKQSELEKVLKLIVASVEKRLTGLPPKDAAAARKKLHALAAATALEGRRNNSKEARNGSKRVAARSSV